MRGILTKITNHLILKACLFGWKKNEQIVITLIFKILNLTFVLVKAEFHRSYFLGIQTENLPAALLKNVVWLHHTSRCQSTRKQLLTKHYKCK